MPGFSNKNNIITVKPPTGSYWDTEQQDTGDVQATEQNYLHDVEEGNTTKTHQQQTEDCQTVTTTRLYNKDDLEKDIAKLGAMPVPPTTPSLNTAKQLIALQNWIEQSNKLASQVGKKKIITGSKKLCGQDLAVYLGKTVQKPTIPTTQVHDYNNGNSLGYTRVYFVISKDEIDDKLPGSQENALSDIAKYGGSGASLGATLGTIIPGIGNIIGTGLGFIAGSLGALGHILFGNTDHRGSFYSLYQQVYQKVLTEAGFTPVQKNDKFGVYLDDNHMLTSDKGNALIQQINNVIVTGLSKSPGMEGKYLDSLNRIINSSKITTKPSSSDFVIFSYHLDPNEGQEPNQTQNENIPKDKSNDIIKVLGLAGAALLVVAVIMHH